MRVLVVDDHAPIRSSLKQLIELRAHFDVVGEGSNGREAVEQVEELQPDIVLMDMNMPEMNGVEATRIIKERHPEIKVLALTAFADMSLVSAMVKAGASGYLIKGGPSNELVESLRAVASGLGALDKEVTGQVIDDLADLYQMEQERADTLAELDRMKSEFVAVVSHELRTPVTSIKGGVQTLRRNWVSIADDLKLELLESMAGQCDKLHRMIGQILTVSGIQKGGLGLKQDLFSLKEVAREAVEAFNSVTEGRDVHVDLTDVEVLGDRARLRSVAMSLIENALNFSYGRITVEIVVEGPEAKLRVTDEGPGIDQDKLEGLLTEPFTQVDSSSTRMVGGLGLSLYIARQVLEASGGRLEVDTAPLRGSSFAMVLPVAPREASATQ